ncbi:hypothetical protein G9274_002023 [Stenotrophomonas rhizophila]|nr:hypothetical protein G9274_002023 [Stenotrophomonas rhizophila]
MLGIGVENLLDRGGCTRSSDNNGGTLAF